MAIINEHGINNIAQFAYFGESKLEKTTKPVIFVLKDDMNLHDFTIFQYVPKHKILVEVGDITFHRFSIGLKDGTFTGPYLFLTEENLYCFDTDDVDAISEKSHLYRKLLMASRTNDSMTKQEYLVFSIENSEDIDSDEAVIRTAEKSHHEALKIAMSNIITNCFEDIDQSTSCGLLHTSTVTSFVPSDADLAPLTTNGYDIEVRDETNKENGSCYIDIFWKSGKASGGTITYK